VQAKQVKELHKIQLAGQEIQIDADWYVNKGQVQLFPSKNCPPEQVEIGLHLPFFITYPEMQLMQYVAGAHFSQYSIWQLVVIREHAAPLKAMGEYPSKH
jgi:hypothetical protein